ncbi:MAG: alpha/beta hydrolase [Chloroflexi bacterium]|nr:alpha/beta hydrolase [Chloroflexota bacterium]MDA1148005.1 alpha/beta hydrolase [Chloroflexota bacterium]
MAVDLATGMFLKMIAEGDGKPLHEGTPEEARALGPGMAALNGPGPEMARIEEHSIPVEGGSIQLRVLVPIASPAGVFVYYHGGGWVIGNIDEYDTLGRKLAERTSCAVVMVEYRLAPEHRYPVAVDDSYAALEWVAAHLGEIAGRTDIPLIVGGDSAGGNLSAVMALRARDRGGPDIALQVLVYPVTDADFNRPSYTDPENQLLLSRDGMLWFWDNYCPDVARRTEPDASPLRASDLSGLPPALVLTAEHDPLRDEGEEYAQRLQDAGVPVVFRRIEGQMHAFFQLLMLPGSEAGMQQVVKATRACVVRHAMGKPVFA